MLKIGLSANSPESKYVSKRTNEIGLASASARSLANGIFDRLKTGAEET
jgi:hypothetical protein